MEADGDASRSNHRRRTRRRFSPDASSKETEDKTSRWERGCDTVKEGQIMPAMGMGFVPCSMTSNKILQFLHN
jgi:hypothetical protein